MGGHDLCPLYQNLRTSNRRRPSRAGQLAAVADIQSSSASTPSIHTSPSTVEHDLCPLYPNVKPNSQRRPSRADQLAAAADIPSSSNSIPVNPSKRARTGELQSQSSLQRSEGESILNTARKVQARKARKIPQGRLPAEIGQPLPTRPLQLPSPVICPHCRAKKFVFESPGFCCGAGAIKLVENEYPPTLKRLLTSMDEDAVHYRTYARYYNNLFAFSSIGGEINSETINGIHVFILQGQMYHYVPDLIPGGRGGKTPRYLQLYFYDGQHETENRLNSVNKLRKDVIDILMEVTSLNPYAQFFRSLKDMNVTEETKISLNKNVVRDHRTMSAPTSDEVAAIWPENGSSSESESPHILVSGKSNHSHRIMHYYGCYDPLQYPLLNVYGESGWRQGLPKLTPRSRQTTQSAATQTAMPSATAEEVILHEEILREETSAVPKNGQQKMPHISCREFYCYKLQARPNNLMLRAGRCLQQYMVDMYVKTENTRLDFFRNNQKTIRAELYQGIVDSVHDGECIAANIGRRVILPPTFIGGPRDMKRRYLNAMSLVQRFGKPDIFLTMTCNPNWPEIKAELEEGEEAQNRPELVTRIFRAKLITLKKLITQEKIFGDVAAYIYVVEFQKRGLPHAHWLIILKPEAKIRCPADFDKFVCAELPHPSQRYLRKIVKKHMMHGPCGQMNPLCPCMTHEKTVGKCKYSFPKQLIDTTTSNKDGYPMYRRRNTGDSELVRNATLDNGWVIPYNPYLLALFDCHLNVEVCSTIQAVKYLYKYVYKGHDRIRFSVGAADTPEVIDEISNYQDGRWVAPCEAAWRLFGFDLFESYPAVMALQVHLPNMQNVQVRPHEHLEDVLADNTRHRTPLTEFFATNAQAGRINYTYNEFTEHYRWESSTKAWLPRINKAIAVGRLTFVVPSEGERYFLRLLLLNVRGPTSFDDLKTVDGYKCATFQEAALKLRLLEEDNATELCLEEACNVHMPVALRRLFAVVLIFGNPKNPEDLWNKYYSELSADFTYRGGLSMFQVKKLTVASVESFLEPMGKTLETYGLGHLREHEHSYIRRIKDIADALNAPISEECLACRSMLNVGQQLAFNEIMAHVIDGKPGAFFIDGPGGTGKTFLYNALYAEVRLMNKIVLPTATSGIAASNIPSGRTAHSRFKIPIDIDASLACDVPKQGGLASLLRESSLIIWDEASMARRENVQSLDLLLRDLCSSNDIFGGKLVVFGGDFRQVLPVLPRKSVKDAVAASIVNSELWPKLKKFRLTENIRAQEDLPFSEFLLALGNGQLQTSESQMVNVPSHIVHITPEEVDPLDIVADLAFPDTTQNSVLPDKFSGRAVLTPLNEDVDIINTAMIEKFAGDRVIYKSFDTTIDDNCDIYPTEFLNRIWPGGVSPHELILKENCPVILLRNILPSFGLCNGTRLVCKRFYPNLIQCEITTGHHAGELVFIPRIKLRPSEPSNFPFQFQRVQFPIKLSFAMTINKAQGQTLDQVVVYLPRPCFSPGQLYVALSRARRSGCVKVIVPTQPGTAPKSTVKNIVSYDVLRLAGIIT